MLLCPNVPPFHSLDTALSPQAMQELMVKTWQELWGEAPSHAFLLAGWSPRATPLFLQTLHNYMEDVLRQLEQLRALQHNEDLDVVSLDIALVEECKAPGWGFRVVELQAFTSLLTTAARLHTLCRETVPWVTDNATLTFPFSALHGNSGDFDRIHAWTGKGAPHGDGVLIEDARLTHSSHEDIRAACNHLHLHLLDPHDVRWTARGFKRWTGTHWRPISHIHNRWIPESRRACQGWSSCRATPFHSPPAGYFLVDKSALVALPVGEKEGVMTVAAWRQQSKQRVRLPCHAYALKPHSGRSGEGVMLHVTEEALQGAAPDDILQPRYTSYRVKPFTRVSDFVNIEMRFLLRREGTTWRPFTHVVRAFRGPQAGMSMMTGHPFEGATLLHAIESGVTCLSDGGTF